MDRNSRSVSAAPTPATKSPLLRKQANTKLNLLKSTFSKRQVLDQDANTTGPSGPDTKSPLLRKRTNTKLNLLRSTFSKKQLLPDTNNIDVSMRDVSMLGTSVLEEETPRRGSGLGREEASIKRRPRRLRLKSIKSLFGGNSVKNRRDNSKPQTVRKEGADKLAQAENRNGGGSTDIKSEDNADEDDGVDGEEMIKLRNNADDHYVKVDDRERIQNFSHLHWYVRYTSKTK